MSQFHRPNFSQAPVSPQASVSWPESETVDEWLSKQPLEDMKKQYESRGFAVVEDVVREQEVEVLKGLYARMLSGDIDTSLHRHDLGNVQPLQNDSFKENICQIMWPSLYVEGLDECPARGRLLALARRLLGEDMEFDFDMMIAKPPHTDTATPWHQDESYWLDMPDKRAVSCWLAVDGTELDNGCMWFVGGSHLEPLRPHQPAAPGVHILCCPGDESEGTACPLRPGSCTLHSGRTMHYSRGNRTPGWRRGYILNFRPREMVRFERERDFDHGFAGLPKLLSHDEEVAKK